jgi:hypothetical protein
LENIKHTKKYNRRKVKLDFCHINLGAQDIGRSIVKEIVGNAAAKIYDLYLEEKMPKHVAKLTTRLPGSIIRTEFQPFDTNLETYTEVFQTEDVEPERPMLDT